MLWLSNHYYHPPPLTAVLLLSTTPPPPAAAAAPSLGVEGSAAAPDDAPPPTSLLAPPTLSPPSMIACPRACCVRLELCFLRPVVVLCVCVFFQFILDVKIVGSTSRGHTGFPIHLPSAAVLALIFLVRRIQPFLSLVDREVKFLRTNDLIVLHLLGIYFYFIIYLVWKKKSQLPGFELTSTRQKVTNQICYGKKKESKITTEKKKRKNICDGC